VTKMMIMMEYLMKTTTVHSTLMLIKQILTLTEEVMLVIIVLV